MTVRVKICCIQSIEEAQLAIQYGASAIGLVSEMPSGPGVISENLIAKIAQSIPPTVDSFLLTSKQDAADIIQQKKRCGVNTVQIVDKLVEGTYNQIKEALPGISIIQVIHVNGEESLIEARKVAPMVDGLLLDSGNQSLPTKRLGGTGKTHDWELSRRICRTVEKPVFLAGGLNSGNVSEAIRIVDPFGVDVCSGARTNGRLDEGKLSEFFIQVRSSTNGNK